MKSARDIMALSAGRLGAVLLLALLPLCYGCVSGSEIAADRAVTDYMVSDYINARQELVPLAKQTDENFVLNNDRLGSTTLALDDLNGAETAFLRSYEVINSVGVNDGGRSLGAALVDEKIKVWKGEPFERAMVNFDLGTVYFMRQDYNNARAAFENALFKLRDYGDDTDKADNYREIESDFVLGYLMLGHCWQRLGNPAKAHDMFQKVAQLRPDLAGLADERAYSAANLLLIVDYGSGPMKVANRDGSIVGFGPGPREAGYLPLPFVAIDGRAAPLGSLNLPPVDLLALAQDRRWQSIDTIRVIKSVVGTGLIVAGAYEGLGRRHSDPAAALSLIAAGLLVKASSQGDLRYWEMLPRTTYILPMTVPPGRHSVMVYFPSAGNLSQNWADLPVPSSGEAAYYMRIQNVQQQYVWPPATLTGLPGYTTGVQGGTQGGTGAPTAG